MTTIKSYTDIKQSKKLAEILPLESADMFFADLLVEGNHKYLVHLLETYSFKTFKDTEVRKSKHLSFIPCWSLAALLDVLQDNIKIEKTVFDQSNMFTYSILGDGYEYRTYEHKNLINACYEMIIKLHKQNLL